MIRVHVTSLGCPKNRVDSERLLGALGRGATPVAAMPDADLVLVNTCAFIQPAIEEAVRVIVEAAEALRGCEPRPVLAVAGCLVSRFGAEELARGLPEVDLWLSTRELDLWPERAAEALGRRGFAHPVQRRLSTGPAFAYLKISEGCSQRCRFCTIPSIRGPHVSRTLESLAAEARDLLGQGVRELVLVGQNVTAYGSDLGLDHGLERLLEQLLPLDGLAWLRLMYLYPAGVTPGLLSFMAGAGERLLPYFDVPLQHAHPDVLRRMGRPFAQDPGLVVSRIRGRFPDAALRTSLIVGYPGETEAHFRRLVRFVTRTRLDHLGVFPYHAEEGTPAAALPGRVHPSTKRRRLRTIMELQAGISAEKLARRVGQTLDVLVEREHPEWPGLFVGRAWFQAPEVDGVTYVSGPGVAPGKLVRAEVVEAKTYDLVALAEE